MKVQAFVCWSMFMIFLGAGSYSFISNVLLKEPNAQKTTKSPLKGSHEVATEEIESGDQEKCLDGSYYYRGSCYFLSNMMRNSSLLTPVIKPKLSRNEQTLEERFPGELPLVITHATWLVSRDYCGLLNKDADLLTIDSEAEFDFLVDLIYRLNFHEGVEIPYGMKDRNQMTMGYQVGLRYNGKIIL